MTTQNWDLLSDTELLEAAMHDEDAAWAHIRREEERRFDVVLIDLVLIIAIDDEPTNWNQMTDAEIKTAVKRIISSSSSEAEARRRIREELAYPHTVSMHTCLPTDNIGRAARTIVSGLGGLVMRNGAMVMGMMHGHDGVISF